MYRRLINFMPNVSVVIPTYNSGCYICEAIESVLAQDYQDFELIVVDDGSTDDTAARLARYEHRIQYIFQHNQERSTARNSGIKQATGQYIAFLDADDYWMPDKLRKQVALLDGHPRLALVYSWAQTFYNDRTLPTILGKGFDSTEGLKVFVGLALGKSLPTLTVVAKRDAIEQVGMFNQQVTIVEDWDLWLRIALRYEVDLVPEVLAHYRLSGKFLPSQMARAHVQQSSVEVLGRVLSEAKQRPEISLPDDLERKALSQAWWRGSLIDYAVSDIVSAQHRWTIAINYDALFHLRSPDQWMESLVAFASNLYDVNTPQEQAEDFINLVFDHLPPTAQLLARLRRATLGRLKAGFAFRAAEYGEPMVVSRTKMRQAVRCYPPLLRNLGVTSICLRGTWLDKAKRQLMPQEPNHKQQTIG